jgi:hypothetical protein
MARIEEVCGGVDQSWFSIDLHFPIHKKMFFVQTNGAFVSSISIMLLQERCWFQHEYNVQSLSALLVSFSLIKVFLIINVSNFLLLKMWCTKILSILKNPTLNWAWPVHVGLTRITRWPRIGNVNRVGYPSPLCQSFVLL